MDRSVHYFTYAKKMLSFVGLWHSQTHRQRVFRYYVTGFMSLYCVCSQVFTAVQVCQLYISSFNLTSAIRLLQVFVPAVCGLAMYIPCIIHFKTMQKIYIFIFHDSQQLNDDTELKIMQTYAHYGNLINFTGFALIYCHLIMNITSSLLRMILSTNAIRSDLDLFPIISCFDYLSNRGTYFYPIIIYQIITNFVLITGSFVSYMNLLTFLLHASARLSIIKYKICSPFIYYNNSDDTLVPSNDLTSWIIDIVKRLARTTKFMALINTVFEKSNLFQTCLAFFLLILDFLCIPILLERKTAWKDVIEFTIYICGNLFMIYLFCYIGQKLIDYSLDIYREVCLVPFHLMSLKTQKLLLITLIMSTKPYTASVGKIYVMSHESFGNLLRNSLSFAMVIHSMQNL